MDTSTSKGNLTSYLAIVSRVLLIKNCSKRCLPIALIRSKVGMIMTKAMLKRTVKIIEAMSVFGRLLSFLLASIQLNFLDLFDFTKFNLEKIQSPT